MISGIFQNITYRKLNSGIILLTYIKMVAII
ncbi:hypothetical protein NPD4_1114 [Clostridium butyricum]|nr:hypothetical protein NPD4_1114 [Clostridium butyricum]